MSIDKLQYLGNCIRSARIDSNLTQQALADQCNISIKTIRNIEKGKMNPSYEILFTIVNRLVFQQAIYLILHQINPIKKFSNL